MLLASLLRAYLTLPEDRKGGTVSTCKARDWDCLIACRSEDLSSDTVHAWACGQVKDRMELLQMALDARPDAHADGGRLALLAELLGVAERHSDLQLRRARAALAAGDVAAAREHVSDLAAQGYVLAWEVAAQARLAPCNSLDSLG